MNRSEATGALARARTLVLVALAALAGGGLAIQARVNGELGVRLGSPMTAGAVNIVVGLVLVGIAVLVPPGPRHRTAEVGTTRWWYWTGGLCAVLFVSSVVIATPRLGVSLVSICTAAGMTGAGLFADRVGLGLAGRHPLRAGRIVAASMAVAAVVISSSGGMDGLGRWRDVLLVVAGGFALGCQHPINSRLSGALGDAGVAALVSFAVGSVAIVILASTHLPTRPWPPEPVLYLGGAIAAAYVLVAIPIVGRLGALRLSLASMTGQLCIAAVLDVVAPIGGHHLTAAQLAGLCLAASAVAITTGPAL